MKVELDSKLNTITLDGVRISLDMLLYMCNPLPNQFMHLVRCDDVVTCLTFDPRCEELQQAIGASIAALDAEGQRGN